LLRISIAYFSFCVATKLRDAKQKPVHLLHGLSHAVGGHFFSLLSGGRTLKQNKGR